MSDLVQAPILKLRSFETYLDVKRAMAWVTRTTGKSGARQAWEMAGLALGAQKLTFDDYYVFGLWRDGMTAEVRRSYVSDQSGDRLNVRLSPVGRTGLHGLTGDKLLLGLTLRAAGFPTQAPRAIFGAIVGMPGVPRLQTAQDMADWLRAEGSMPVFGKPLHKEMGIGGCAFLGAGDEPGTVRLGDGRTVNLMAVCQEIAAHFSAGYLFEPLIRQHKDVVAIAGPAVSGLRVVTLRTSSGAEALYVLLRLPALGAMIDGPSGPNPTALALVDPGSGKIVRAQISRIMTAVPLEASLVTGKRFDEVTLPFVDRCIDMAIEVHRLMSRTGSLGFDFALAETGPILNEVNSNTGHSIYQKAADRGLLNPEFRERIDAALAIVQAGVGKR